MKTTQGIIGLLLVCAAVVGVWPARDAGNAGWQLSTLDQPSRAGQVLEPTAAGRPFDFGAGSQDPSPAVALPLQPDDSGQAGSTARGRVARMFYRTHDNIFLSAEHTPTLQRIPERLYAEVEYPERLKSGALSVLSRIDERFGDVRIGDVVDLRLAHKHDPKNFPVRETTRVTALVARSDSVLARAFETSIAARKAADVAAVAPASTQTLSQALGVPGAK